MSIIPGEYCGQYALDENNFLTKLKELKRDQLTYLNVSEVIADMIVKDTIVFWE